MGYCITMLESKFEIKKEDFDKALESLKSVFVKDKMTCQDSSGYHYSWVNTNYVLEAETLEEAEAFLEDCMAVVVDGLDEVKEYFEENGMDISDMTREELEEASEVFALPNGQYLIVEG